jgi:hypothetical protein
LTNSTGRRLKAIWDNHVLRRVRGRPSPSTFWALPEPPNVVSPEALESYLAAGPNPPYLMDYTSKPDYAEINAEGIPVLHYPSSVGTRVNPEAAFQLALGLHDRWLAGGGPAYRDRFLFLSDWFARDQTAEGCWLYRFCWHQSADPWGSALAQMRGASVMLRAGLLTGEVRYEFAARAAMIPLSIDLPFGGMRARHRLAGVPYFEEYPAEPSAVLNGFIATLFGLFELATWLSDAKAAYLLTEGVDSLERMLPHYVHRGWTLYDLDPATPFPNPNSPRYHRLVGDYLRVLAVITGRPSIAAWRDRWHDMDTPGNRARAIAGKTLRKLWYK